MGTISHSTAQHSTGRVARAQRFIRYSPLGPCAGILAIVLLVGFSAAEAQYTPKIDSVLLGTEDLGRSLRESPRWLVGGASAVAPIIENGFGAFAKFDGGSAPTIIAHAGDVAYTDGFSQNWIFGARLDEEFDGITTSYNNTGSPMFRGSAANGDYVAFYAGLVEEGTPLGPVPPLATKIGVFRWN